MKKVIIALLAVASLSAATPALAGKKGGKSYGKTFKTATVQSTDQLLKTLDEKGTAANVAVEGQIAQVCQAEGCWLKLKNNAGGDDIMVKMKNHSFFVPKDIGGKQAVVYGSATKKTISVEEQKHMMEDAGAAQSDMDAITTPKEEVRFEATGVVVK